MDGSNLIICFNFNCTILMMITCFAAYIYEGGYPKGCRGYSNGSRAPIKGSWSMWELIIIAILAIIYTTFLDYSVVLIK